MSHGSRCRSDLPVSIVLGAGGARGMAHIGVLGVLQDAGFRVTELVGTSVGALIVAFYGAIGFDMAWVREAGTVGGSRATCESTLSTALHLLAIGRSGTRWVSASRCALALFRASSFLQSPSRSTGSGSITTSTLTIRRKWGTLMKGHWFWDFVYLNSNYHLEHHYFPGVPFYRLPALQRALAPFYERKHMRWMTYRELVYGWMVENRAPHTCWSHTSVTE